MVVPRHFLFLGAFAFTAILDEFELIMLMMKEGGTRKGTCSELFFSPVPGDVELYGNPLVLFFFRCF
jgi:hypothetical protein